MPGSRARHDVEGRAPGPIRTMFRSDGHSIVMHPLQDLRLLKQRDDMSAARLRLPALRRLPGINTPPGPRHRLPRPRRRVQSAVGLSFREPVRYRPWMRVCERRATTASRVATMALPRRSSMHYPDVADPGRIKSLIRPSGTHNPGEAHGKYLGPPRTVSPPTPEAIISHMSAYSAGSQRARQWRRVP